MYSDSEIKYHEMHMWCVYDKIYQRGFKRIESFYICKTLVIWEVIIVTIWEVKKRAMVSSAHAPPSPPFDLRASEIHMVGSLEHLREAKSRISSYPNCVHFQGENWVNSIIKNLKIL